MDTLVAFWVCQVPLVLRVALSARFREGGAPPARKKVAKKD